MPASMMSLRSQFLYIVVLCQPWFIGLSRFQYYLDCDCTFDLFDWIEVYSCKVSLLLSQLILKLCLCLIKLYSLCCEVKNSFINLLHSVSRDLLQFSSTMKILISTVTMIFNCKIKIKTDETLIKIFIRTLSEIFDKNHMTLNNHSDKIKIN